MDGDQYVAPQEIFNGWWSSFLFLGSWERRLWMCSQGESKYLCTEWVWSPCMPLFIAEHSRREVISWHFVLSGWLGVCVQYAVAAPFHFLSSEKPLAGGIVIKSIYCCRDGSFSSARVSSFFPSVRQIFIFGWLNGFNLLPYCSVKWKKNGADRPDGNIVPGLGRFILQAIVCLLKQWVHSGADASPWGTYASPLV